jgi:Thiolase, N-terminal domain
MAEAYIVEAVRTAEGRRNGKPSGWDPADMAAETLNAIVDRSVIDPAAIEDVILGCVTRAGERPSRSDAMPCLHRICRRAFRPSPLTGNAAAAAGGAVADVGHAGHRHRGRC